MLRVGISSLIICDLIIRSSDLTAHYSNQGVLPLELLFSSFSKYPAINIHTISGSSIFQGFLFILAAITGFSLLIGFYSKISTIVTWILLVSLHNRNPLILQGGDDLLRMIVFWGMFLPWGKLYSIDYLINGRNLRGIKKNICSVGTAGYILQIISMYFFSAMLKTSDEWRVNFTAAYYALNIDQIAYPAGKFLLGFPGLLKVLTCCVFYFELLIPLLLLVPVYNSFFRKMVLAFIIGFHLAIGSLLYVGLFFIIGIISVTGLITQDWIKNIRKLIAPVLSKIELWTWPFYNKKNNSLKYQYHQITKLNLLKWLNIALASAGCLIIFYWNFQSLNPVNYRLKNTLEFIPYFLRLDQNWGMFSPGVFKDDGWYIYEGETTQKKIIDLNNNGRPITYNKPKSIVSKFSNDRWRKYSENYLFQQNAIIRPYFCNFLMTEWNKKFPNKMVRKIRIIYMKEITLPDYKYSKPVLEILYTGNYINNGKI